MYQKALGSTILISIFVCLASAIGGVVAGLSVSNKNITELIWIFGKIVA